KFSTCCRQGLINIALPNRPPPELWQLWTRTHALSRNFFKNIRQFNAALAFTSMGAKHVDDPPPGAGPWVFKIGGEHYHNSGDLQPAGPNSSYAQLYIFDNLEEAANIQSANPHNSKCDCALMRELNGVLHASHHYAERYKHAWQRMDQQNPDGVQTVRMVLRQNRNDDRRRYNLPTSDEIALIVPDNSLELQRDIVL
ncbi:hypothetical protein BDV93DRAFT_405811, partial [Ceratobasidium sp. AG-I]